MIQNFGHNNIKAVIFDENKLFRKGISLILNNLIGIYVLAELPDDSFNIDILLDKKPDLLILNFKNYNQITISLIQKFRKKSSGTHIILLTKFAPEIDYNSLIEGGIKAILPNNIDTDEFAQAINLVLAGKKYYSQEIMMDFVRNIKNETNNTEILLTKREIQVLTFICKGYSNIEIAKEMYLSPRTIESHRAKLLNKTSTKNSIQLVVYAIKNNLYQLT